MKLLHRTDPFVTTIIAIYIALALLALGVFYTPAHANPSQFLPSAQTAVATSTTNYMTPGTATTTLSYDSYQGGQVKATDSATLLVQFTASSTVPKLNISFEYSQDGIDWYGDDLAQTLTATTTVGQALAVTGPNAYSWQFASSTLGGVVINASQSNRAIQMPFPLRYTRAVITTTGGNAAIWAEVLPKRELN